MRLWEFLMDCTQESDYNYAGPGAYPTAVCRQAPCCEESDWLHWMDQGDLVDSTGSLLRGVYMSNLMTRLLSANCSRNAPANGERLCGGDLFDFNALKHRAVPHIDGCPIDIDAPIGVRELYNAMRALASMDIVLDTEQMSDPQFSDMIREYFDLSCDALQNGVLQAQRVTRHQCTAPAAARERLLRENELDAELIEFARQLARKNLDAWRAKHPFNRSACP